MTEEQWQKLYENYETSWLLDAVSSIDELRDHLGDGPHFEPPQIRTDLLKLHDIAMDVVNNGWQSRLQEMINLAHTLNDQILDMMTILEKIQDTTEKLVDLLPETEFEDEDEFDDEDKPIEE